MSRKRILAFGAVLASGVSVTALALAQQPTVVVQAPGNDVIVPVAPDLKFEVVRGAPPAELVSAPQGVVYIGHRGSYWLTGAGQEGRAIFRDGSNRGFSRALTYYGGSGNYWVAAVGGAPNTYFAFQVQPSSTRSPYFQVLMSTSQTGGYMVWDEATRSNVQ